MVRGSIQVGVVIGFCITAVVITAIVLTLIAGCNAN